MRRKYTYPVWSVNDIPRVVSPFLYAIVTKSSQKPWIEAFYKEEIQPKVRSIIQKSIDTHFNTPEKKLEFIQYICDYMDKKVGVYLKEPYAAIMRKVYRSIPMLRRKIEDAFFDHLEESKDTDFSNNLPANIDFYLKHIVKEIIVIEATKHFFYLEIKNKPSIVRMHASIEAWLDKHYTEFSSCREPVKSINRRRDISWLLYSFFGTHRFKHFIHCEKMSLYGLISNYANEVQGWRDKVFSYQRALLKAIWQMVKFLLRFIHYMLLPLRLGCTLIRDCMDYVYSWACQNSDFGLRDSTNTKLLNGGLLLVCWAAGSIILGFPILQGAISILLYNNNYLLPIVGSIIYTLTTVLHSNWNNKVFPDKKKKDNNTQNDRSESLEPSNKKEICLQFEQIKKRKSYSAPPRQIQHKNKALKC